MKKILFCTSSLSKTHTGAAIFAQLFLEWARERSIEVVIISSERTADFKIIPFVKHRKVFTKIPLLQSYHRSFIYYKTVKEQISKAKQVGQDFDLIFFNSTIESLHSAKLVHEIPVWAFLHDENFMNDYQKKRLWKRKLYRGLMKRHEGKAVEFLNKVITNSKHMKQSIVDVYGKHPIDVSFSYFRSYDLPGSKVVSQIDDRNTVVILFVKHDAERGGLRALINAIEKLDQVRVLLHLVGVDPIYLLKHREALSRIEHHVDTYLSRDELHKAYSKADIFCVPSYSEALGLANLEALQYGKPVVVMDIQISKELLKIEPMFFLSNPSKLSRTLMEVIESSAERAVKREAGFRFVYEHLSREKVFNKWDRIFSTNYL